MQSGYIVLNFIDLICFEVYFRIEKSSTVQYSFFF